MRKITGGGGGVYIKMMLPGDSGSVVCMFSKNTTLYLFKQILSMRNIFRSTLISSITPFIRPLYKAILLLHRLFGFYPKGVYFVGPRSIRPCPDRSPSGCVAGSPWCSIQAYGFERVNIDGTGCGFRLRVQTRGGADRRTLAYIRRQKAAFSLWRYNHIMNEGEAHWCRN